MIKGFIGLEAGWIKGNCSNRMKLGKFDIPVCSLINRCGWPLGKQRVREGNGNTYQGWMILLARVALGSLLFKLSLFLHFPATINQQLATKSLLFPTGNWLLVTGNLLLTVLP